MNTWVAALIAASAITLTYFFCIRPMTRGRSHCAMPGSSDQSSPTAQEIASLREELRVLRAQDTQTRQDAPPGSD